MNKKEKDLKKVGVLKELNILPSRQKKEKVVKLIRVWNNGFAEELKGKQLKNFVSNEHNGLSCLMIRQGIYGKINKVKWKKIKVILEEKEYEKINWPEA